MRTEPAPESLPPSEPAIAPTVSAHWNIREPDADIVQAISSELGLSPLTATLLVNRGVTNPESARVFLSPKISDLSDPYRLPDMEAAVDRLTFAIKNKERIFVHGDYDVDGVTSAALCLRALTGLGADVIGYVPRRSDGYDLQKRGVEKAKEVGAKLLFTADCGIKAVEPVNYAKEQGLDVIITDHHRPGAELPSALAVVNPYREDAAALPRTSLLRFQDFVGVAVAYKTLDALTSKVNPAVRHRFQEGFLDLVALGTVQDMSPLLGENRLFVTYGLKALANSPKKGIHALLRHFQLTGQEALTSEHIGWKLGPLLNAAGRMDDADLAYRLLTTRDEDEAEQIVAQLDALNQLRKDEQARMVAEAYAEALLPPHNERRVLVLARPNWKHGLAGLAAGNLTTLLNRPVILLSYYKDRDEYHGSARGWGTFAMLDALKHCDREGMLGRYGGHSMAAGLTVFGPRFEEFCETMHELAEGIVDMEDLAPAIDIDAELPDARALTFEAIDEMDKLEPFGRGNEEPVFATRGARVLKVRRVGKDANTLQVMVQMPGLYNPMKAVWFKSGAWADKVTVGDRIDLAYRPKLNHYMGSTSVELMLKDLRIAA